MHNNFYDFVLFSAVWQCESAICTHIALPSCVSLPTTPHLFYPSRSSQTTKLRSLCYTAASHYLSVLHVSIYMVLEKAEEPEIKLPTSTGSWKKQESSRKTSISASFTMPKPLTVWITINCGKFWKRWQYQTIWPASWEICMQVRKQQLELDMEQQTGSK